MKNLAGILFLVVLFLGLQQCSSNLSEPVAAQPASTPNVDFIRSEMISAGIDSQRIEELVTYLRPLLFSTLADRKLENWYTNKTVWIDKFGDVQNVLFTADIIYADYLGAGDLKAAAQVKNATGRIHASNGDLAEAIDACQLGYEFAKRTEDSTSIGWNLTAISRYFAMLNDLSTAEEYADRTLGLARSMNDPAMEASILNVIGGIKSYQSKHDSAIALMKESIGIAKANDLTKIEEVSIINLSFNYNRLGLFDESIAFLNEHSNFTQIAPSPASIFIYYNLQSAYLGKREYDKASYYLNLGCEMANEYGSVYAQLYCKEYSTALYKEQGLYQKALAASERTKEIQAKLTGAEQTRAIQSLKTRLRLLEKDLEIERLDQASKEREQAYQKRFSRFIATICFLAFFILVIYLIMRNRLQVKSAEQQKELAETKLQVLQSQMHPHFIFNALGGIQNYILKSEKITAYKYLGTFATLLRTITKSATQVHIELGQEVTFIKSYLDMEKLRFRDDFVYSLTVDPLLEQNRVVIPSMIIQPIVENALIHGLAGLDRQGVLTIEITPAFEQGGIYCTISDNGRGRQAAKKIAEEEVFDSHLSIATVNTQKRLDFLRLLGYEQVAMEIEDLHIDGQPAGTRASLFLPTMQETDV